VPGDLETIRLKCLRKLPAERYHTCVELAQDLASWQAGRPIAARRPGLLNRLHRWAANPARVREAGALSMLFAFQTAQYAAILFLGAKTRMPQKQARDGLFACPPDFRPRFGC
jgi:eukaryotic-like serine/threonine-protein kinase